jgi:hypothetical protein
VAGARRGHVPPSDFPRDCVFLELGAHNELLCGAVWGARFHCEGDRTSDVLPELIDSPDRLSVRPSVRESVTDGGCGKDRSNSVSRTDTPAPTSVGGCLGGRLRKSGDVVIARRSGRPAIVQSSRRMARTIPNKVVNETDEYLISICWVGSR